MNTRRHPEEGSLLLTMLLAIAVGGMVMASFALVRMSQDTTRRDRGWNESIQVAEAGLQQAFSYITTETPPAAALSDGQLEPSELGLGQSAGSGNFTWTARKVGTQWLVRAEGTVAEVTRVVEATLTNSTFANFAMFSDEEFIVQGGNTVRSYDSSKGLTPCNVATPTTPCKTNGHIGSNKSISWKNNSYMDHAYIYDVDGTEGDVCSACDSYTTFPSPFDMVGYHNALVVEARAACPDEGVLGNVSTGSGFAPTPGNTYCVDDLLLDADYFVPGNSNDDPVVIYVWGNVLPDKKVVINCLKPSGLPCETLKANATPMINQQPAGLQIKVVGATAGTTVELQNQSVYSMTIDAPNSVCNGPGGQTTVYGYMICKSIPMTNGGWDLMYDEDIASSGTGRYRLVGYREELLSTTGFPA